MNNGTDSSKHQNRQDYDSNDHDSSKDMIIDSIPYAQILSAQDTTPAEDKLLTNPKIVSAFLDAFKSDLGLNLSAETGRGDVGTPAPLPPFGCLLIGAALVALLFW